MHTDSPLKREQMMASSFASYVLADKMAEIEARARRGVLQQTLEEAVMAASRTRHSSSYVICGESSRKIGCVAASLR